MVFFINVKYFYDKAIIVVSGGIFYRLLNYFMVKSDIYFKAIVYISRPK